MIFVNMINKQTSADKQIHIAFDSYAKHKYL